MSGAGGKRPRQKGDRTERAIVKLLQERGLASERIPLSGASGGRYGSDVSVPVAGRDLKLEVKCRRRGFSQIYGWLGEGVDALVIKADRKPLLLVVPLRFAAEIAALAEQAKARQP